MENIVLFGGGNQAHYTIDIIEKEAKTFVRDARRSAWDAFQAPLLKSKNEVLPLLDALLADNSTSELISLRDQLLANKEPLRRDLLETVRKSIRLTRSNKSASRTTLKNWLEQEQKDNIEKIVRNVTKAVTIDKYALK